MTRLRVLVCGGRDYADRVTVWRTLSGLCGEVSDGHPLGTRWLQIIHGGCPTGADFHADEWSICEGAPAIVFEADWSDLSHPDAVIRTRRDWTKFDVKAGPRRNQRMIDEGKPDLVVAFPGGRGTADMVRRARQAGIEVMEISGREE